MQISKLGKVHVKRLKGMAMGHTLSSVKGNLVLRHQGAKWLHKHDEHKKMNSIPEGCKHYNVVASKRYADDIVSIRKILCQDCLKLWLESMYCKTMEADFESFSTKQDMCDVIIESVLRPDASIALGF